MWDTRKTSNDVVGEGRVTGNVINFINNLFIVINYLRSPKREYLRTELRTQSPHPTFPGPE